MRSISILILILLLFISCISNVNSQVASKRKDLYHFPLYPWNHDYHQAIVFKTKSSTGDSPPSQVYNVEETLDQIKTLHYLSRGMPIIVYLSGWQQGGHDHQFPLLTEPGKHLMRPGIDSTPLEALRWLIQAAKVYNTTVSLQINMHKAVADNELYWQYKKQGLFSSGPYEGFSRTLGVETNRINTKLEWDLGYTQKRIDNLLVMLPELSEIGTIHIDNFRPFESEIDGTSREDIMPYLKAIMYYFKDKYGIDVTCESIFNKRPNNDNLYGFQPWALSFTGMKGYKMKVPAYMYCGGRKYDDEVFGTGSNFMKLFYTNDYNFIKESLYTRSFPLYYLSRLIRLEFSPITGVARLSNNVTCHDKSSISIHLKEAWNWIANRKRLLNGYYGSSESVIECDGNLVKQGTDIFLPAIWRSQREMIAYSKEGYTDKRWIFPANWSDVQAVDIYEIRTDGITPLERRRSIRDNTITLSLATNQGVAIIPAGANVYNSAIKPFSGEVVYLGEDRDTKGSWIDSYGVEGYAIIGGDESLPADVNISYIGGEVSIWTNSTTDQRALQKTNQPEDRMIAQRSMSIHEIVEIRIDDDTAIDVALYFVDWDNQQRQMIVDAVCANTNRAMHTVILKEFTGGVYLNYRVKGRVQFRFTILGEDGNTFNGGDVTYSGTFFGTK